MTRFFLGLGYLLDYVIIIHDMMNLIINLKERGLSSLFHMRFSDKCELPLVLAGTGSAIWGMEQLSIGNFKKGAFQILLGMAGIQIATWGHNESKRVFEKAVGVFGTGAFLARGVSHLGQKAYLKSAVQFAAGAVFGWISAKSAFDPKVPVAVGLIANSAFLSLQLASSGWRDLNKEGSCWSPLKGTLKMGCALSLAAATACCAYQAFQIPQKEKEMIFGTTYLNSQNLERNELSSMTDQNHAEYASRHGMVHIVDRENRLVGQCQKPKTNETDDCAPYWNKIQMFREWIQEAPKSAEKEEWRIFADDDMPVTNLRIDPREAIDRLRRGDDSSVIIVQDSMDWFRGNPKYSINTGLLFVRKDEQSLDLFDKVWKKRNDFVGLGIDPICPTLGLCKTQEILHEQEAFARVLRDAPSLFDRVVTVISQRGHPFSDRTDLALNTFYRQGAFLKQGESQVFSYENGDSEGTVWQPGDWMGQPAGVPLKGWRWTLGDSSNTDTPPRPIRKEMLQEMLSCVQD